MSASPADRPRIGVFGAGAIGCYLGGRLLAAGEDVVLVGRLGDEVAAHGLTLTDFTGGRHALPPDRVPYRADASALADREIVLVTVKSLATAEAGEQLARVLPATATVVSLQNGVRNPEVLRAAIGTSGPRVLAGMVPFNVLRREAGQFHLGTSGRLMVESAAGREQPLVRALARASLPMEARADIAAIAWGKLLLNLNNSINALAGIPLRDELSQRGYRRVLSASIREGVSVLRRAGIAVASAAGGLPPTLVPYALLLPDLIFTRVARAMLTVDADARSSMWDDLERRRPTEIDELNGEVVRQATLCGMAAPVNRAICELVRSAEQARAGSPRLGAAELLRRVGLER